MRGLTRNQWIAAAVGVVVVTAFALFGTSLSLFNSTTEPINTNDIQFQVEEATMKNESAGELKIVDTVVGGGAEAKKGDTVTVHYTGTFPDGKVFDSSLTRGQPFSFKLGAGGVIEGWDLGVVGMKVGGKRSLTVPPGLGYGPADYGPIPGNSTLMFDIELLGVK